MEISEEITAGIDKRSSAETRATDPSSVHGAEFSARSILPASTKRFPCFGTDRWIRPVGIDGERIESKQGRKRERDKGKGEDETKPKGKTPLNSLVNQARLSNNGEGNSGGITLNERIPSSSLRKDSASSNAVADCRARITPAFPDVN